MPHLGETHAPLLPPDDPTAHPPRTDAEGRRPCWPVRTVEVMRSLWQGTISFGLSALPVDIYAATEDHGPGLHLVHAADGGRIRHRRVCELDGREV